MPITPDLFDDDPVPIPSVASLVPLARAFGQSKKAKTVSRLLAQVASLRQQFDREKRRLEEALILHAAQVRPRQERVTALRTDVVRRLAGFLDDRRLTKTDTRALRALLMEQLDEILAHVATPDPEIAKLFERLHHVTYDEAVQSELDGARAEMEEFFAAVGLDVEIPDLRPDMTEEEMAATAARMADRMRQLHEQGADRAAGRRKTKREIKEEQKAERHEQLRKMSIGSIYKRLAKALHPDLEPDPSTRERKSALMQEVTTAYAANDLHTLLRLEFEWIDGAGAQAVEKTDETLTAYAEVLRRQVAELRAFTMELPLHPKYQPLIAHDNPFGAGFVIDGPAEVRRLDAAIEGLEAGLGRLSDEHQTLLEVRGLIRMYRSERGRGSRRR